ncbi:MAG: acyl--CoA ligase, partial [Sphingomonadales bacterium]|nr:acyl--CoA ligase [Sphingomonadales bacterium]
PREKIEDYLARGWWNEATLGDLFLEIAARQPSAPALADPPNSVSIWGRQPRRLDWSTLLAETGRMAALLDAQGLRRDDVVLVQLPNGIELHAIYLACALGGIVVSPLPVQYRGHEIDHALALTRARVAICAERVGSHRLVDGWRQQAAAHPTLEIWAYADAARPALPDDVVSIDEAWRAVEPWSADRLREQQRHAGVSAHDVLTICWTSGTEASPKGVPRNHNEWRLVGRSVLEAAQLPAGARMLIPFPFVNMAGVSTSLVAWLMLGGELLHHHPFDLQLFIDQLRRQPVDYTVVAPALLARLLKDPDSLKGIDFGRLRRIGSGGGPVAPWLVEQFGNRFGVEIVNYFGSNEGAALSSSPQDVPNRGERARYFPRLGVPGYEWSISNSRIVSTRLVDADTAATITEPGQIGELRFKGPTIFSGYFGAPELTANAFDADGYYRSGDLFEICGDRHQFYRYAGRLKDIVIRGGMNISCQEVENLLLAHPKVHEAAVIGVPDPEFGERVCAVVAPQPGA